MSVPAMLEMSKDSIRRGGWGSDSILPSSCRVPEIRSSRLVTRSASCMAFSRASCTSCTLSPRWGTRKWVRRPVFWNVRSENRSPSSISIGSSTIFGAMPRER